jgi:hypothetical protein
MPVEVRPVVATRWLPKALQEDLVANDINYPSLSFFLPIHSDFLGQYSPYFLSLDISVSINSVCAASQPSSCSVHFRRCSLSGSAASSLSKLSNFFSSSVICTSRCRRIRLWQFLKPRCMARESSQLMRAASCGNPSGYSSTVHENHQPPIFIFYLFFIFLFCIRTSMDHSHFSWMNLS